MPGGQLCPAYTKPFDWSPFQVVFGDSVEGEKMGRRRREEDHESQFKTPVPLSYSKMVS